MEMEHSENKNIHLHHVVEPSGCGTRGSLITQVKNIAEIMLSVGDLQKAKILFLAVNRLEQQESLQAGKLLPGMTRPVFID